MKKFEIYHPKSHPNQHCVLEENYTLVWLRRYDRSFHLYVGIDANRKVRFFRANRSETHLVFRAVSHKSLKNIDKVVSLLRMIPTAQKWMKNNSQISLKFENALKFKCTAFLNEEKILSEGKGLSLKDAYHMMWINHYITLGLL